MLVLLLCEYSNVSMYLPSPHVDEAVRTLCSNLGTLCVCVRAIVWCCADIPYFSHYSLGLESLEYGQVTEMAFLNLRWESVNFGCFRMKRETLGKIGK